MKSVLKTKFLSLLLALAMTLGVCAGTPLTAMAAGGGAAAPVGGGAGVFTGNAVCLIDQTQYFTLQDAFTAAENLKNPTIKLLQDYTIYNGQSFTSMAITFDLNGHNLVFSSTGSAALILIDSDINYIDSVGGGTFTVTSSLFGLYMDGGSCELTSVSVDDNGAGYSPAAIILDNNAVVTVNGNVNASSAGNGNYGIFAANGSQAAVNGNISVNGIDCVAVYTQDSGTAVTVNGNVTASAGWGIEAHSGSNVTVTGSVTSADRVAVNASDSGTAITVNGNITASNGGAGVAARSGSNITVTGNITSADSDAVYAENDNTAVTVNGNVSAAFSSETEGLSGIMAVSGATVTINGKVDTTSVSDFNTAITAYGDASTGATAVKVTGDVNAPTNNIGIYASGMGASVTVGGTITGSPDSIVLAVNQAGITLNGVAAGSTAAIGTITINPDDSSLNVFDLSYAPLLDPSGVGLVIPTNKDGYLTYADDPANPAAFVWVKQSHNPAISGLMNLSLHTGYEDTQIPYSVTGDAVHASVSISPDTPLITYNTETSILDIAPGLQEGVYTVTLTAGNGAGPDASLKLNLTVTTLYPLTVIAKAGGTVTQLSADAYAEGSVISISAKPDTNYQFSYWTSSNGGTFANANAANTTFTMPATQTSITAVFTPTSVVPFTPQPSTGGGYSDNSGGSSGAGVDFAPGAAPAPVVQKEKPPAAPGWQNPFSDVSAPDWFYNDVAYCSQNGLFNGLTPTTFGPDANMTRAMFVTVLWRAAGSPGERITAAEGGGKFADVMDSSYYYQAVSWATAKGIVKGVSGDKFAPDQPVTREQMAAILYRYEQFSDKLKAAPATMKMFADQSSISEYAQNPVNVLAAQGIINGMPNNTFAPQGMATRAQVAAVLHRFMEAVQ